MHCSFNCYSSCKNWGSNQLNSGRFLICLKLLCYYVQTSVKPHFTFQAINDQQVAICIRRRFTQLSCSTTKIGVEINIKGGRFLICLILFCYYVQTSVKTIFYISSNQ